MCICCNILLPYLIVIVHCVLPGQQNEKKCDGPPLVAILKNIKIAQLATPFFVF